jgi:glycerophosphoryl diester phosphodiesterase
VTRVVAHRGFRDRSPENTVRAVRRAVRDHAPAAVEVDVRPTADGDPVCLHDARLDDLTDRTGLVRETPTDEACAARVAGTDATVARLDDVLRAAGDVPVVVEAKSTDLTDDALLALRDRVLAATADAPCEAVHQSFDDRWLPAVRERTTAPVAVLARADAAAALDRAARFDARAVHLAWPLVAGPDLDADPSGDAVRPAAVHDAGRECWAWTVRDPGVARRLGAAGVDALTVDDPAVVG